MRPNTSYFQYFFITHGSTSQAALGLVIQVDTWMLFEAESKLKVEPWLFCSSVS